jgi:peptidoglycan biosynthesis protein MviN/MurJ (putative lipid II flippase)
MVGRTLDRLLGSRWQGTAGEHRAIIRGLIAVAAFAFLGKLAGAAKEVAVAWRYGVSAEVDAYLFVFNLVNWPLSIWFSVLTVVLIPMAARMRQESPTGLRHFQGELLGSTLLLGAALAVLGLVGLPPLLASSWVGLPPRTAELAIRMVPVLAWVVVPGLLAGLYSIWMMSAGGNANTLLEGLPALGILIGVLLTGGIEPLIWGTLAGTLAQLAFVAAPMRAPSERHQPMLSLSSPHWPPFWQAFGVMMLGQGILSLTTLVDQFFAARLGEGAISSLGFASRIIALIVGIVATAVTRSMLPVFSRTGASGVRDVRTLALRWAGMMALVGVAAVAIGWLLAPWTVRILFQRGTFTADDTARVAALLRYGLVQLPFYFYSLVLVSMHASLGRYKLLMLSGLVGLGAKTIASFLLLPAYGVGGLMLAQAAVYASNTLLLAKAHPR